MQTLKGLFATPQKRKIAMMGGVVLVGLFFIGSRYLFSDNPDTSIPTSVVKAGKVTIKITENGELRAQDQVTISAAKDKQILWLAPEGSWVEEGDTLVVYESEKYVISTSEAESNLKVNESALVMAMSDLEAQRAKEEAAQQKYLSLQQLAKDGFAVESEVDQARLAYIELRSKTRSFEASVEAARANVQRAERALSQQERKLREGVATAPRAGLVVYAYVGSADEGKKIQVGMIPFEGMDLMYLPDISSMRVDTQISEVDLARVHKGMRAEINLDAYPDTTFAGEVESISDLAKRKISRITGKPTGAKVFDVEIKVLAKDIRLKPGLTATVDIIVTEYDNALYIPLDAVFLDELDNTIVYVKKGGAVQAQKVELGESNDRIVIIKSGLSEGMQVLLGRPTNV